VECNGPALKGDDLCYMHRVQAGATRKLQEFRQALGLQDGQSSASVIRRAIREVIQELLDGRIDNTTAGRLIIELQAAASITLPPKPDHKDTEKATRTT